MALAANALDSGDVSFANMICSTQTDEARHAQQGGQPWRCSCRHTPSARSGSSTDVLDLGPAVLPPHRALGMDYYTPLEHRKQSYKEFMEEWIVAEFLA